jgi:hypothetical protein
MRIWNADDADDADFLERGLGFGTRMTLMTRIFWNADEDLERG